MSNVTLSNLYNLISASVDNEIITQQSTIYSYVGKTTPFIDGDFIVNDNVAYDQYIRDNIIFAKKIPLSDISYLIPRYDWKNWRIFAYRQMSQRCVRRTL